MFNIYTNKQRERIYYIEEIYVSCSFNDSESEIEKPEALSLRIGKILMKPR